jgi:hypothetical protein
MASAADRPPSDRTEQQQDDPYDEQDPAEPDSETHQHKWNRDQHRQQIPDK